MTDTKWWDEKNQHGSRVAIHHKGLMPTCFNCNTKYKIVKSDKEDTQFKAEHPKNGCPFIKHYYGQTAFECLVQLRDDDKKRK